MSSSWVAGSGRTAAPGLISAAGRWAWRTCATWASSLLSFYGQHEHRKLMLGAAQLDILDRHCGPGARLAARPGGRVVRRACASWRARGSRSASSPGRATASLTCSTLSCGEIEAADPATREWDELTRERGRLRHLDSLRAAAGAGVEALDGEGGGRRGPGPRPARSRGRCRHRSQRLSRCSPGSESLRYEAEDSRRSCAATARTSSGARAGWRRWRSAWRCSLG